jgi:hypothetical protein
LARNDSGKAYLKIYTFINNNTGAADIESKCRKQFPGPDFAPAVNYLYAVLMKNLIMLQQQVGTDEKLLFGIQEVKLLFRKGLPEEGFKKLEKLRSIACRYEKFDYSVILDKMLLHYLSRYSYQEINEEDLLRIQSRLRRHLQYELNLADHASLYELLHFRFLMLGNVRSAKDKDKLNDLVFSEMNLAGNPKFQSFNLKKNHLLFQSVYFMMTGDQKSSMSTFYELNSLFEANRHLWSDSPIYYVNHLKGILNNLHMTGQYEGMEFFISKLEELKELFSHDLIFQIIYVSKLKMLLGKTDYESALMLVENEYLQLADTPLSQSGDRAELLLYTAIVYFNHKSFKMAARLLVPAIHMEYLPNIQLSRMLKLINLIIHFEINDFHYVNSGIRSLERELKKSNRTLLTENIILKMLKKYPESLSRSSREKLLRDTASSLLLLKSDPFERQLFYVFDFEEWIKRKKE